MDIEKEQNNPRSFIVKGSAYYRENDPTDNHGRFAGFGGHKFTIKRLYNGEIIESKNLWHRGEIPIRFKDRIKDNAEFIN